MSGVLLDRLVDGGATSAPATGLYDASGQPKPSAAAVKQAIGTVARGAVVCPGLAAPVTPTTLTFPAQLSSTAAASVTLGCSRDCLYLVTLDRANGRPVVARRGGLDGGAAAQTITLPEAEASRRQLPPRRPARQPRRPRCRNASAEWFADRRLTSIGAWPNRSQSYGRSWLQSPAAPAEMEAYLAKVRDRAYAVVDRDIEELKEAGFSEDEIFEQTVAVAITEGLRRLDRAAEVIR